MKAIQIALIILNVYAALVCIYYPLLKKYWVLWILIHVIVTTIVHNLFKSLYA